MQSATLGAVNEIDFSNPAQRARAATRSTMAGSGLGMQAGAIAGAAGAGQGQGTTVNPFDLMQAPARAESSNPFDSLGGSGGGGGGGVGIGGGIAGVHARGLSGGSAVSSVGTHSRSGSAVTAAFGGAGGMGGGALGLSTIPSARGGVGMDHHHDQQQQQQQQQQQDDPFALFST